MDTPTFSITLQVTINKPIAYVWQAWATPADIMQWNIPFNDWHCPRAENDLQPNGSFLYRMETKDGSVGFDYSGQYDKVINYQLIESTGTDGRKSTIAFIPNGDTTTIVETFEPETSNSSEMQKGFCQSVLNNFKKYVEARK